MQLGAKCIESIKKILFLMLYFKVISFIGNMTFSIHILSNFQIIVSRTVLLVVISVTYTAIVLF